MSKDTQQPAHTPGPWKVDVEHHHEGEPLTISTQLDFGHDAWTALATVATGNFEHGEANARLIAAAPETAAELERVKAVNKELVEALKYVRRHSENPRGVETEDRENGRTWGGIVDAAIAKATNSQEKS